MVLVSPSAPSICHLDLIAAREPIGDRSDHADQEQPDHPSMRSVHGCRAFMTTAPSG